MKVAFACDHGGFPAKEKVISHLEKSGYAVKDFGTFSEESCDYPEFAVAVCKSVLSGESDKGVLICGTGIGMSIVANKIKGIRCAHVTDLFSAEMTRRHNNTNVRALGARITETDEIIKLIDKFLTTEFDGGRHQIRVDKISKIEEVFGK